MNRRGFIRTISVMALAAYLKGRPGFAGEPLLPGRGVGVGWYEIDNLDTRGTVNSEDAYFVFNNPDERDVNEIYDRVKHMTRRIT